MKKFIFKFTITLILISFIYILLLISSSAFVEHKGFKNWQTESNTLIIPKNEHFDVLITGISHARNFSRHCNHQRIEKILNKKIINIGQGEGKCGVNELYFYLKYFYLKKNTTNLVLYVLSPPLLYSESLPIASNTFDIEAFKLDFLISYLHFPSENKKQRILDYLRQKLRLRWIQQKPSNDTIMDDYLTKLDTSVVNKGFKVTYPNGLNNIRFNKSCNRIEEEINTIQNNNSKIIFIILPALFGKWPGHNETIQFAKKMKQKYNVNYYNF